MTTLEEFRKLAAVYENSIPTVQVPVKDKIIVMATPNEKCLGFALDFHTREPATNTWISGFRADEVFFDIGANNGMYGLLAAVAQGCIVHAFEPHFASYYITTRNVYFNRLQERMTVYPLAISDGESYGKMFLSGMFAGKSLNNYGEARPSEERLWNAVIPQGSVSTSLDRFVELTGIVPHHIKIDVDGLEPQIIKGAAKLLHNPQVQSVMLETDETNAEHRAMHDTMQAAGFGRVVKDKAGNFYYRG